MGNLRSIHHMNPHHARYPAVGLIAGGPTLNAYARAGASAVARQVSLCPEWSLGNLGTIYQMEELEEQEAEGAATLKQHGCGKQGALVVLYRMPHRAAKSTDQGPRSVHLVLYQAHTIGKKFEVPFTAARTTSRV